MQTANAEAAGVTLVSYADGPRFERSQRVLKSLAGNHGVANVVAWNNNALQQFPEFKANATVFALMKNLSRVVREHRPYCMAFKPLALLRALIENDGRWVLWTDSSQWNLPALNHSLVDAAAALQRRNVDAVWGTAHCQIKGPYSGGRLGHPPNAWMPSIRNAHKFALVSKEAMAAWLPDSNNTVFRRRFLAEEHVLATHLFMRSTPLNRAIAARWLRMAVDSPRAFCASNQDQAALALLAFNERLTRVDYCGPFKNSAGGPQESADRFMGSQTQKQLHVFVHALASGAFEVRRARAT